jgi:hypothetical protein
VFCRETGWKDEDEAVEARDGVCNITDMLQWATEVAAEGPMPRNIPDAVARLRW